VIQTHDACETSAAGAIPGSISASLPGKTFVRGDEEHGMKCWTALLAFGLLLLVVGCKSRPALSTTTGANGADLSVAPVASTGDIGAPAGTGIAGSPASSDTSSSSAAAGAPGASAGAGAPGAAASVGTLRSGPLCSGVAVSTLSVVVTDGRSEKPICDAEVSAQHESGYALELRQRRLPNGGCPYVSFRGSEGKFTVSARKPGFAPASQTTTMVRRECGFHAPAVRMALQPS